MVSSTPFSRPMSRISTKNLKTTGQLDMVDSQENGDIVVSFKTRAGAEQVGSILYTSIYVVLIEWCSRVSQKGKISQPLVGSG